MKVHSEFVIEDVLNGSNIDVDVARGTVTLNGTVKSMDAKTKAAAIAPHSSHSSSLGAESRSPRLHYFTEYLVNAPPAWLSEFGPSAA